MPFDQPGQQRRSGQVDDGGAGGFDRGGGTGRFDPFAANAHGPAFVHRLAVEDARRTEQRRGSCAAAGPRAAAGTECRRAPRRSRWRCGRSRDHLGHGSHSTASGGIILSRGGVHRSPEAPLRGPARSLTRTIAMMHATVRVPRRCSRRFRAVPPRPAAAQKRNITENDLLKFVWVADPQISPDGSQVAFVRVDVNEKADSYDTSIWIVATDGTEPAAPPHRRDPRHTPRWSPDGRRLAFVRAAEKDGRVQPPQIHVMSMAGGEARAVTDIPRGAGNPAWSPDGTTIAFSSTAEAGRSEEAPSEGRQDRRSGERRRSASRTSGSSRGRSIAPTASPGSASSIRDRPAQIWTVAVPQPPAHARDSHGRSPPASSAPATTAGPPTARRSTSSPTGAANRTTCPCDSDLYAVAQGWRRAAGRSPASTAASAAIPSRRTASASRSSARCTGNPERSYSQTDLWVVDAPGGTPRNLTAELRLRCRRQPRRRSARAARRAARARRCGTADGRSIFMRAGIQGNADLVRVDVASGEGDGRHRSRRITT